MWDKVTVFAIHSRRAASLTVPSTKEEGVDSASHGFENAQSAVSMEIEANCRILHHYSIVYIA